MDLVVDLLGQPSSRTSREWRWNRHGSLSAVVSGPKAGQWFDHEAGAGGGPLELIQRQQGSDWRAAADWARQWLGEPPPPTFPRRHEQPVRPNHGDRQARARRAAEAVWNLAVPADAGHPYLRRKGVAPHGLRQDSAGRLVIPLLDLDGVIHTIEWIDEGGTKRFMAGGAKAGHFALIGGPLADAASAVICEGWATGASIHEAAGLSVVVAMDAGNLRRVAERVRSRYPDLALVIAADNDAKPGRTSNPGVAAATAAAEAVNGRLAVPPMPGDFNDMAIALGAEAVKACLAAGTSVAPATPTYPAPTLTVAAARTLMAETIDTFMAEAAAHWAAAPAEGDGIDLNAAPAPPLLALPVEVGLGKSTAARQAIAVLIASGALGGRKVVYAVPRHDLGHEQAHAFAALGINAMVWKGRLAPAPTPTDPERQMCLDPDAPFDALEVELAVEQAVCRVKRRGNVHLCARYHDCGYQAQKPVAAMADVIVCAHDSLFHEKPAAIGTVGLLVIDESFWQSGLRGTDGRTILTLDGLRPIPGSLSCYDIKGRIDWDTTADLVEARGKLWRVLGPHGNGAISVAALRGAGLTPKECRLAAGWERRRLRDPGLLPGMDAARRAERIRKVLPPEGEPWAPPGRAAALWMLLADALVGDHDAAGAVLFDDVTRNGTVRSLRLLWRAGLRDGWAAGIPVLHLDATLRPELVRRFLPTMRVAEPVNAVQPHVTVRQIVGAPTTASALSPTKEARERDHTTAARNLRDIAAFIALRAGALRGRGQGEADMLVVGQKDAVARLSAAGLPARVVTAHFNGLSGLDRWGGVAGLVVLGRTLPAPVTVESLAAAMTNRPVAAGDSGTWWYGGVARTIRLDNGGLRTVDGEAHADPLAEAIRWSICEAELIQAIGRARGVNRAADTPLEIDLLTDIVLPVTVHMVAPWDEVRPSRTDIMAAAGVILDNAADMARCFPDLWASREVAKKDAQRRGTNGYYRDLYNSQMSPSSVMAIYQPAGAGQKPRRAVFDTGIIRDPRRWLEDRLGPLVRFEATPG